MIKPHRGRHRTRQQTPEQEQCHLRQLQSQSQRWRLHNSQLMVVIAVILALFQIQMGMSRVLMSLNRICSSPYDATSSPASVVPLPLLQLFPGCLPGNQLVILCWQATMCFIPRLNEVSVKVIGAALSPVFHCNFIPAILACHEFEA